MEIVEHVEDVNFLLKEAQNFKKIRCDVHCLNKTLKSYLFAIVGAEYVLKWFQ